MENKEYNNQLELDFIKLNSEFTKFIKLTYDVIQDHETKINILNNELAIRDQRIEDLHKQLKSKELNGKYKLLNQVEIDIGSRRLHFPIVYNNIIYTFICEHDTGKDLIYIKAQEYDFNMDLSDDYYLDLTIKGIQYDQFKNTKKNIGIHNLRLIDKYFYGEIKRESEPNWVQKFVFDPQQKKIIDVDYIEFSHRDRNIGNYILRCGTTTVDKYDKSGKYIKSFAHKDSQKPKEIKIINDNEFAVLYEGSQIKVWDLLKEEIIFEKYISIPYGCDNIYIQGNKIICLGREDTVILDYKKNKELISKCGLGYHTYILNDKYIYYINYDNNKNPTYKFNEILDTDTLEVIQKFHDSDLWELIPLNENKFLLITYKRHPRTKFSYMLYRIN